MNEYENTEDNLKEIKALFSHKLDLLNFLKNEVLFLYKIIISTLNNIQNNFCIRTFAIFISLKDYSLSFIQLGYLTYFEN